MTATRRVAIADDHSLVREGLKVVLASRPDFEVTGEAADGLELLELLRHPPAPDAVILDITMPKLGGIEAAEEISRKYPDVKILVLTMHKDEDLLIRAFGAGADAYVLKQDLVTDLFAALDAILASDAYVSSSFRKKR